MNDYWDGYYTRVQYGVSIRACDYCGAAVPNAEEYMWSHRRFHDALDEVGRDA